MAEIVVVGSEKYDLDTLEFINSGGEAEVFRLPPSSALKVYEAAVRGEERTLKVLALCDKASFFDSDTQLSSSCAFPDAPSFEDVSGVLNGYAMPFVDASVKIEDLFFNARRGVYAPADSVPVTDASAVQLCYRCFQVLDELHRLRIVLGDVNPGNILVNRDTLRPTFIDLDSAAFDQFEATARMQDYLDPLIAELGESATGRPLFSADSDRFALACICYRLIVGMHPYHFNQVPPKSFYENALEGKTLLNLYVRPGNGCGGNEDLIEHVKGRMFDLLRLDTPQAKALHNFFVRVFTENFRDSLGEFAESFGVNPDGSPMAGPQRLYRDSGLRNLVMEITEKRRAEERRMAAKVRYNSIQPAARTRFSPKQSDPPGLQRVLASFGISLADLVQP